MAAISVLFKKHGELVENKYLHENLLRAEIGDVYSDLAPKSPLPKLAGLSISSGGYPTLEVGSVTRAGVNSRVFSQLERAGVQVVWHAYKANRLEELFVSLVHEKQGDRA